MLVVIEMNLIVGDKIKLDIRKQGINAEGIGYHNKTLVFVPGAILKESVNCEIISANNTYATAKILEITHQSKKRVSPPCKYYDECGGCHMQHIEYKEQLKIKQSIIKQSLKKYTRIHLTDDGILKTIGMDFPYKYRNKSQMPFKNTNFGLALGFYKPESNHFVFVEECLMHHDVINKINREVLRLLRKYKLKAYDNRNKEGILLHLVTRYFERSDSASVTFVVREKNDELIEVARELLKDVPSVKSVSYSINDLTTNLVLSDKTHIIAGVGWIEEKFKDLMIKVSPDAFHQLNTLQMEKMYDRISEIIDLDKKSIVFDLYSGIGITSLLLAKHAKKVYGIDYSHASIKDAYENARINRIENVEFVSGHVETEMPRLIKSKIKPDVVVVDPPRKGLSKHVIDALIKTEPRQIVYISCNPSTLAKNISELENKYQVIQIQPIDMFPNAASVESITILKRLNQQ